MVLPGPLVARNAGEGFICAFAVTPVKAGLGQDSPVLRRPLFRVPPEWGFGCIVSPSCRHTRLGDPQRTASEQGGTSPLPRRVGREACVVVHLALVQIAVARPFNSSFREIFESATGAEVISPARIPLPAADRLTDKKKGTFFVKHYIKLPYRTSASLVVTLVQ